MTIYSTGIEGVSRRLRFGPGYCEPGPLRGPGHAASIPEAAAIAAISWLSTRS